MRARMLLVAVLGGFLCGGPDRVGAQTRIVTVDEQDAGTVRDAFIDGFPNVYAKDGTPDAGNNALAVALKAGITELRAVVEFPLAELAGVAAEDVVGATLTFNIDDVLSTFGPGTDFNNRAADTILVHTYDGDGTAALQDYGRNEETPATVSTGAPITDASLNQNGAVAFTVDLTARVQAAVGAGTPFLGILWRTNDSPTGTSIDNLGEGSGGPPGARGSKLPFLTVEIRDEQPPPNCGNGTLDAGEGCDDGNTDPGDCCSRLCQYEAVDAPCNDGDACTDGDSCDGGGTCRSGGQKSCDDGSTCTDDSCDPGSGCINVPINEGGPCDDGNACTTNDVCGGGTCSGSAVGGTCDDGDPCTVDDQCGDGTCAGTPLCGNGAVDASCSEECDDSNRTGADGCSATCRYDALVGGTSPRECLVTLAFANPVRAADGSVAQLQRCRDGDPTCDADPTPDTCGFDVAACVGKADPRLPSCPSAPGVRPAVVQPGKAKGQRNNRSRLAAALASTSAPSCTPAVRLDVPLRKRAGKRPMGKVKVVLRAGAAGVGRDRDTVVLVCEPRT